MTRPDRNEGALQAVVDHRVLKDLEKYIIPTINRSHPVAPSSLLEGMAGSGNLEVTKRPAVHNDAVAIRAMMSLQCYRRRLALYYNGVMHLRAPTLVDF